VENIKASGCIIKMGMSTCSPSVEFSSYPGRVLDLVVLSPLYKSDDYRTRLTPSGSDRYFLNIEAYTSDYKSQDFGDKV
jgi:hypothetical protein